MFLQRPLQLREPVPWTPRHLVQVDEAQRMSPHRHGQPKNHRGQIEKSGRNVCWHAPSSKYTRLTTIWDRPTNETHSLAPHAIASHRAATRFDTTTTSVLSTFDFHVSDSQVEPSSRRKSSASVAPLAVGPTTSAIQNERRSVAGHDTWWHIWANAVLSTNHVVVARDAEFVPLVAAHVVIGVAYWTHLACLSEFGSQVPCGKFGFARAVLGFYIGFLVAALQLLQFVAQTALAVLEMASFLTTEFDWLANVQPLLWLLTYATIGVLHCHVGRCRVACVGTLLMILGSWPQLGIDVVWKDHNNTILTSVGSTYVATLHLIAFSYIGVEAHTTVTYHVREPSTALPKGNLYAVKTLGILNLVRLVLPLAVSSMASWAVVPARFGAAFGLVLSSARLAQTMADSNLLPPCFRLPSISPPGDRRDLDCRIWPFVPACGISYCLALC
ncbi:Aste57867_3442 [Aphanomyces stellatus]|uniref:Aste57867_3442 protein n=1 Tax=Aphanomyces stellatus TaxID=120398 RepID=A0A485KBE0_9STRA|nr:hypothetical protein As57867_003432 [Aphanomyces stellatus]VFT80608.1 Aste57867_3442 [Aphanomyces stellatus]